jgi:hypothetical protein
MSIRFKTLALIATLTVSALPAFGESPDATERIAASYVLAFGRAPTEDEIAADQTTEALRISDLVAKHHQRLQRDAALKRETAMKAFKDAFGRTPSESELAASIGVDGTYTDLMKHHIDHLAMDPSEYEKVMERAYRLVIRRGVYPEEVGYWRSRDTLPYVLLVGCIEDWGRRNAPGLMVTTGTPTVSMNSNYLTTVRLSPSLVAEARTAAGLMVEGTRDFNSATGRNLVAAGAANLVTGGRIAFVASGGANLLSESAVN